MSESTTVKDVKRMTIEILKGYKFGNALPHR